MQLPCFRFALPAALCAALPFALPFLALAQDSAVRGEGGMRRYAIVLADPPLVQMHQGAGKAATTAAAVDYRAALEQKQIQLRQQLPAGRVLSADSELVNAVFVLGSEAEAAGWSRLPGVNRVEPLRPVKLLGNRALDLVNARGAWSRVNGGESNAGAGVKIGIIDTGIDHQHPAFAGFTGSAPSGFPRCGPGIECGEWTNNKVIVARSYVSLLNFQYGNSPSDTRPDDNSPRDRNGHGTMAAAVAAGSRVTAPAGVSLSGIAPAAHLGNYKVFGSPGVNETTYANVIIEALNDARRDGMDIVTLNLGYSAEWPALLRTCGQQRNQACDIQAEAVHNLTLAGVTVVAAAGNDGRLGFNFPTLGTIKSPATAPGAIAVGAIYNSHIWVQSVNVQGGPASLTPANIRFSDGPRLKDPLTAPIRDVAPFDDTQGKACRPLPNGSLTGAIAVIQRGDCDRILKVAHAQAAGAVAVLFEQFDGANALITLDGLQNTAIPSALIGSTAGKALRAYLASNSNVTATLDPAYRELDASSDEIADFSSRGPTIGEIAIKPEIVAPGSDLYMATQTFDPNSPMFDPSGYTVSQGTSFAAPYIAGAAALVKQRTPSLTPAQIKSVLVNSADFAPLREYDSQDRRVNARVTSAGGGKLNAGTALQAVLVAEPATVSFGVVRAGPTITRGVVIRNLTGAPLNFRAVNEPIDQGSTLSVVVTNNGRILNPNTTLTLNPAGSTQLVFSLDGSRVPNPGSYTGFVRIEPANGAAMRIPYLYLVGDNVPFNIYPLSGDGFIRTEGNSGFSFKVIDRFGLPASGVNLRVTGLNGTRVDFANERTDDFGIAEGRVILPEIPGPTGFRVDAGNLTYEFTGVVRERPVIRAVRNAASGQEPPANGGYAPGSYITITGSALSDVIKESNVVPLPVSLGGVSVSFDSPANQISAPGRLTYVSPGQVNVQIPMECAGLTSVSIKVAIGNIQSRVLEIPIGDYAPAMFEYQDANGQRSVAALDGEFRLIGPANPVARGGAAQIFANGLGPVDRLPRSGHPAPAQPLSVMRVSPVISVGGRPAQVLFAGLAPQLVGLYQVNITIPSDLPTGRQRLSLSVNGIAAPEAFISIR
jgi:uncharacterized protein (TIGR03437 family)